jgi:hypothetical protein
MSDEVLVKFLLVIVIFIAILIIIAYGCGCITIFTPRLEGGVRETFRDPDSLFYIEKR